MDTQTIRPGRWGHVLAALILGTGGVLAAMFAWQNITDQTEGQQRVVVPGTKEITFAEAGEYSIFYEYHSTIGNKVYLTQQNLADTCSPANIRADARSRRGSWRSKRIS